MPLTADGELHLYRVIALDHAVRADHPLWPRYASGMIYGYGAPLFHYFSPMAFHLPRMLHLIGFSYQAGWLGAMMVYTLVAAGGAFLWGRWWAGDIGGFIAAAAYSYAPYFLFDTAARGTISETAGLALLPYIFWAFSRLAETGARREFALATGLFAAFIPLHNIITLHGAALLALYCLFLVATHARPRLVFIHLALAGMSAVGLTAFFWWPALADTHFVKLQGVTDNLPDIDPTRHLRPLAELFTLGFTADPTQQNQPVPIVLGWPQLLLGVLGAVALYAVRGPHQRPLRAGMAFFALLTTLLVILNLPISAPLWEQLPLMRYTQFAWRTLGPASLFLALMAGIGVSAIYQAIARPAPRRALLALALGGIMLYSIPWLYRPSISDPPAQDIRDFQEMERRTGQLAASSFSEYVPVWNTVPLDSERLRERFATAEVIPRLVPPSGVVIHSAEWGGTWGRLTLSTEEAVKLTFDWLYFDGWRADLDGQRISVEPSPSEGLVQVHIPEGEHQLYIALGPTETQTRAVVLSVLSFAFALVILWRWPWNMTTVPKDETSHSHLTLINCIAIGILSAKILLINPYNTPFKSHRLEDGTSPKTTLNANFNNQIQLIGADLPTTPIPSTEPISLTLYWRLLGEQIAEDYSSIVHLRDTQGNIIAEGGSFAPGNVATSNWLKGYYIQERVVIALPIGTPPGNYTLDAGLYRPQDGARLNLINTAGNPQDVKVPLGTITMTRPTAASAWRGSGQRIAEGLYFLGLSQALPAMATVGDELIIQWRWGVNQPVTEAYRAQIVWRNADQIIAGASQIVPLVATYPTTEWRAGDQWLGHHRLYVPGSLESGKYALALRIIGEGDSPLGEMLPIGEMVVSVPERLYATPDIETRRGDTWKNGILLLGYDLSDSDITLYWQTRQPLTESLRLFVHIVDGDGRIIAQTDGIPADWSRPTTGWDVDEIIMTRHTFDLAIGAYTIRAGWYRPDNNERISLVDGGDALDLTRPNR